MGVATGARVSRRTREHGRPASWAEALATVDERGAGYFLSATHELEIGDPEGIRWPRAKVHDDKTLALVTMA